MGRRWSRKRKNEEGKTKKAITDQSGRNKKPWAPSVHENRKMEAYYAVQGLHNEYLTEKGELKKCTTDEEKGQERMRWLTSLRTMLPVSFRIGTDVDKSHREQMELELEEFIGKEMEIVIDPAGGRRGDAFASNENNLVTKKIAPAKRIPFIPHGYQLSLDRRTIRRNPALEKFHTWLTTQTSAGFITRQETVSMIPPVVLSVEPHHSVLDMCAAPGSKTSQILETVSLPTNPNDLEPRGCVVANDSDPKRAFMLVHQLRRINSPAVLVTSCDAQFFPLLKDGQETGEGMFDRVLCDVPCSGDGTTRKNPGVWKHWSALGSLALHPLQLAIALNGARLTKVGGYICYSTCAMNPMENEAVVAELLRAAEGALELVDKRPNMPRLLARPGWSSWRVLREDKSRKEIKNQRKKNSEKMQNRRKAWSQKHEKDAESKEEAAKGDESIINDAIKNSNDKEHNNNANENTIPTAGPPPSWDEATLVERARVEGLVEYKTFEQVPEQWQRKVRKTCFPPTKEEADRFGLEKCLRCLPHDMDTGGFFVALLKKVAPMSAKAKKEALELAQEFRSNDAGDEEPDSKRAKTDDADGLNDEPKGSDVVMKDDDEDSDREDGTDDADDADIDADSQFGDTTEADNTDMITESEPKQQDEKPKGRPRGREKPRGDDESFIALDDTIWEPIVDFYGLADTFPRDQFMARACGDAKALYFVGTPIKNLMNRGIQDRVTIINTGLKGFARNTKDCKVVYRVAQEGIHYLAPHMTKRKIIATYGDFSKCVDAGTIRLETFTDEFADAVRKFEPGSFVVALKGFEHDVFQKLYLVMWRCRGDAVNCLVAKVEMEGVKSKLRAIPENEAKEAQNLASMD